jgi:hypothetical protein
VKTQVPGNARLQYFLVPCCSDVVIALVSSADVEEFLEPLAGMYGAAIELLFATGASLIAADSAAPIFKDDHKSPQRPPPPRW